MRVNKLLFWLSFSGGLIMLGIGVLLQMLGSSSTHATYSKFGIGSTTFGGRQSIYLGIMVLLMSAWNYRNWRHEVKEREKRIAEENTPRVKNNRFFRRLKKQNERDKA